MDDSPPATQPASRPSPAVDRELLVAQYDWVRSVANHLVRDRARAEDVTQETVLAALAAPPRDAADAARLRAWLGRVAFNLSKLGARQGMRRRAREERAARGEATPSVSDEAEAQATLHALEAAIAGLPAPYRQAVELRYFEGLSTAEIGRRAGTSDLAVRKRLWRARGKLRESLEGPGERRSLRAWLAPLLAFGRRPSGHAPTLGSLSGAAAAAALLGLAGVAWWGEDESAARGPLASSLVAAHSEPETAGRGLQALVSTSSERREQQRMGVSAPAQSSELKTATPPTLPPSPTARTRGLVVDLDGNPRAGLDLFAIGDAREALARSDRLGVFQLERGGAHTTLEARAPGWTTVAPAQVRLAAKARDLLIVVAPSAPLVGRVVDPEGRVLENVELELRCRESAFAAMALAGIDRVPRLDSPVLRAARSASDGSFGWSETPRGHGLFLRARAEGYVERDIATSELTETVLLELVPEADFLTGIVLEQDGSPAAGARVTLGRGTAISDPFGRFRLPLRGVETDSSLVASQPGVETAIRPGFGGRILAGMRSGAVVTLGEAQALVEGELSGAEGEAKAGWRVLAYALAQEPNGPAAGPAAEGLSDAEGRFRLSLDPGRYTIVAWGEEAGSYVEEEIDTRSAPWSLRVDPGAEASHIGRLLVGGSPVPAAHLDVSLVLPGPEGPRRIPWRAVDSAGDGRWTITGPSNLAFEVRVDVPEAAPDVFRIEPGTGLAALALDPGATLLVRAPQADSLRVLDAAGEALVVRGPFGIREGGRAHAGLQAEGPALFEVSSTARWLALTEGGVERLVPLALTPGRVTSVQDDGSSF